MPKKIILVFSILLLVFTLKITLYAKNYKPVLSGNYETGDKTYLDVLELDEINGSDTDQIEEIDSYHYQKLWLKYKQKLTSSNYYYIKTQYNKKKYQQKVNYNNIALDLWANYTHRINNKLRNRFLANIRKKDYNNNKDSTYQQFRLKYQLDYQLNKNNDCSFYAQRQWKSYNYCSEKNNIYDRISFSWDCDLSDSLSLTTGMQLNQTKFQPESASSDKVGKKINIGFKCEL